MKNFLILSAFIAIAVAFNANSYFRQGLDQFNSDHVQHHEHLKNHKIHVPHGEIRGAASIEIESVVNAARKRQQVPPACTAALNLLVEAFNGTECRTLGTQYDYIFNDTTKITQNDTASACANTCIPTLKTRILASVLACRATGLFNDVNEVRNVFRYLTFLRLPCIQVAGSYCLPRLKELANAPNITNPNDPSAETTVTNFCHPCFRKFLLALGFVTKDANYIKSIAAVEFICFRSRGKFCALEFMKMDFAGKAGNQNLVFDIACRTRCMSKIVAFWVLFNPQESLNAYRFFRALQFLCSKNDKSEYCFTKFTPEPENVTDPCDNISPCTAECKNRLTSFNTRMGCCFRTLLKFYSSLNPQTKVLTDQIISDYLAIITAQCGVKFDAACKTKKQSVIKYTAVVDNLNQDYFVLAKRIKLIRAIRRDLLRTYGLEDSDCKPATGSIKDNKITVEMICDVGDDEMTTNLAADANADKTFNDDNTARSTGAETDEDGENNFGNTGFALSDPTTESTATLSAKVENTASSATTIVINFFVVAIAALFL